LGEEDLRNSEEQHMLFNMDIHLDGDRATSKSYGHARHERTDKGDFWHIYAIYEHEHSAIGTKRTFQPHPRLSAIGAKRTSTSVGLDQLGREWPKADIADALETTVNLFVPRATPRVAHNNARGR
jgi:hypothetical protein